MRAWRPNCLIALGVVRITVLCRACRRAKTCRCAPNLEMRKIVTPHESVKAVRQRGECRCGRAAGSVACGMPKDGGQRKEGSECQGGLCPLCWLSVQGWEGKGTRDKERHEEARRVSLRGGRALRRCPGLWSASCCRRTRRPPRSVSAGGLTLRFFGVAASAVPLGAPTITVFAPSLCWVASS